jgi:hypothetical protein
MAWPCSRSFVVRKLYASHPVRVEKVLPARRFHAYAVAFALRGQVCVAIGTVCRYGRFRPMQMDPGSIIVHRITRDDSLLVDLRFDNAARGYSPRPLFPSLASSMRFGLVTS